MPRFVSQQYAENSWLVVDTRDNVELFGDRLPKTKLEADVCANAANAAARKIGAEIINNVIDHLNHLKAELTHL